MNTPIDDFVKGYAAGDALRLHMPGHKGAGEAERFDLTEIRGADSLYEARQGGSGIISQSEENASSLFGFPTFYSTEGSSQCIRAMLLLAVKATGRRRILAARNAHSSFVGAAALLGLELDWLFDRSGSYLCCLPDPDEVERAIADARSKPAALYITSPDYLGNTADIPALSQVCRRHRILLICDCAHGAYLRFLSPSRHPIDLGADICCCSAHKTLPVLTGGAYLHISQSADRFFVENAKSALALFGSTSPSYLTLASLDRCNAYLDGGYPALLCDFAERVGQLKSRLAAGGYRTVGDEPLKLTLLTKPRGYPAAKLASMLEKRGLVCEFADPDLLVMMLTPELGQAALDRIADELLAIPQKEPIEASPPAPLSPERVMSPAEALWAASEELPIEKAIGRVMSCGVLGCPPAVALLVAGERITEGAAEAFDYYGIERVRVVC